MAAHARSDGARSANSSARGARTDRSAAPVDASYLESLVGYNARRVAIKAMGTFAKRMAPYDLKPVDFSVLSLITHNPGITSRQLCRALDILPPNLVGIIGSLDQRGLLDRRAHPEDGRAIGLHLSETGQQLMLGAQATASQLEADVAHRLTPAETKTLIRLLKKIYL